MSAAHVGYLNSIMQTILAIYSYIEFIKNFVCSDAYHYTYVGNVHDVY